MKKNKTIIIVDDDADDQEIIRDAFIAAGSRAEFICLENSDALLHYINEAGRQPPSLIMLDLNMPGKDGRDALKEIKMDSAFNSIPVVVFTTSSSPRDKEMSYVLGANCFITKPDTFKKLTELASAISTLWVPED